MIARHLNEREVDSNLTVNRAETGGNEGFVKMGKPRSADRENTTEKRAQKRRDLQIYQPQRALF